MKTLIDKLRKVGKGFKRGILVATAVASLGVASCKLCPDPEPINYAPEASLYVNPTSGQAPLDVSMELDGTDANGQNDIVEYRVSIDKGNDGTIDEVISQSNPINIIRNFNYVGDIKISGQVTDTQSAVDKKEQLITISNPPPVDDYLDVSGKLEDCENDTGKQGRIKIYDSLENYIGETQTDSNGNFSFHSDAKKATDLSSVILRAISTDVSSNQNSYVRTVTANVNSASEPDVTVNPIRVVPYSDLSTWSPVVTPEQFKTFMKQIDFYSQDEIPGLAKFDLSQLQGIEILKGDPLNRGFNFTPENQTFIKNKIDNLDEIGVYVEKKDLNGSNPNWTNVQVDSNNPGQDPSNKHYTMSPDRTQITDIDLGWIIVVPSNIGGGQTFFGYLNESKLTGIVNRVRIELGVVNDAVPTHEFGHAFIASNLDYEGHVSIPPFYNGLPPATNTLTIMTPNNLKLPPPGVADEKAAHIIYENTYQAREKLDDILGTIL